MLELQLDKLKDRGLNPYQAALMAAKEAHVLNRNAAQGISELKGKPTVTALEKLMDGRIIVDEEEDPNAEPAAG